MLFFLLFFFFFFSSRRRHTRYIGDWSSDVCSSDLGPLLDLLAADQPGMGQHPEVLADGGLADAQLLGDEHRADPVAHQVAVDLRRSEERRVGKECRSRWWPEH